MQPHSQQAQNTWTRQHAKGAHLNRHAGWQHYLKSEPTTYTYNNSKHFIYTQTIFHHVSVAATAIVREVHLSEPKYRCFKLPICLIMHTQIHFASPLTQGASQQALCWCGHKVNLSGHETAYNSDVLVHTGGLPWRWLCPPLKYAGIQFDCIQNLLNCYMCILLVQFLDNNFIAMNSASNIAKYEMFPTIFFLCLSFRSVLTYVEYTYKAAHVPEINTHLNCVYVNTLILITFPNIAYNTSIA
jgi:hypothetical protein